MNDSSAMNNGRQRTATRSFSRKYLENGERPVVPRRSLSSSTSGRRTIQKGSRPDLSDKWKLFSTPIRWIIESTQLQDGHCTVAENHKYFRSYFSAAYGDRFFGVSRDDIHIHDRASKIASFWWELCKEEKSNVVTRARLVFCLPHFRFFGLPLISITSY